ncbi:ABC transporter ATP-binding protein [Paenibacillus motobuensis]|uniref:ABC transporter ATP-binding protein n=1 Tax=Paenibacillus motobuensis TaxID=295324 RepID=A0ABP3HYJ2_9BACL
MIEVRHIDKSYGSLSVLKDINWRVQRGQFWGIIGPNGSGKSTLISLLSGVEKPNRGEISLDGRLIAEYGRKELSRKLAVLQQDGLPPVAYPVREVIEMGRFPFQNWRGREDSEAAQRLMSGIMDKLELNDLAHRPLHVLSGGQRQRVALGKVMAQQPEIVLLDEPTTYLDIRHQTQFMELVASWQREAGLTVVSVMHDLNLAALYCDRLLVLHQGRIVAEGSPTEIINSELIESVFQVQSHIVAHPDHGEPQLLLRKETSSKMGLD